MISGITLNDEKRFIFNEDEKTLNIFDNMLDITDILDFDGKVDTKEIYCIADQADYNVILFNVDSMRIDNNFKEYSVSSYFSFKNKDMNKPDELLFERIKYTSEELDYFYGLGKNYSFSINRELGIISLKVDSYSETDNSFDLNIDDEKTQVSLGLTRNCNYENITPITLETYLAIDFSNKKKTKDFYRYNEIIQTFLSFITYRKNINIKKVEFLKMDVNNKYTSIGEYIDLKEKKLGLKMIRKLKNE